MAKKGKSSGLNVVKIIIISAGGLSALLLFYLLFASRPFYSDGFRNLQELQAYAKSKKELVKTDTDSTLRPVFDKFYEQYRESFGLKLKEKFGRLLSLLFLKSKPIFSASFFKTLIDKLGKEREKKQWTGNLVKKINATESSKFVIFGNLQGAFHSLVRDLTELKKIGIIDDSLKILNPDHYIVVMGDVVSRSPYSMETLAIIMRLMEINKDQFVYLRGNHESKNYWQKHTLKRELQVRAAHLSKETLPLETEVNKLFNTLPLGLYISIPGTTNDFLRISDEGRRKSKVLQEHNFVKFLTTKGDKKVSAFVVKQITEGDVEESGVNIKSIIRGEKKRESFQKMEGLRFLAPDIDSVAWNVLSCPTFVYQKALKFFHDAFVILAVAKDINQWLLVHYSRDLRTKEAFKKTTYELMSGVNTETKVKIERYRPKPKKKKKKDKKEEKKPEKKKEEPKKEKKKEKEEKKPEKKKKEVLPAISKKAVKGYLIEKELTSDQWEEVFEDVLTEKQREKIEKKLALPQEKQKKEVEKKTEEKEDEAEEEETESEEIPGEKKEE